MSSIWRVNITLLLSFLFIFSAYTHTVNAEISETTLLKLNNPNGNIINIDNYSFQNPFGDDIQNGIYYGSYFLPSVISPYIYGDNIYFCTNISFNESIIGSGVTEFKIMSPYVNNSVEQMYIEYYSENIYYEPSYKSNNRWVYEIKGVFHSDNYTFCFYTQNTNINVAVTEEMVSNDYSYIKIDDIITDTQFYIDTPVLFITGAGEGVSFVSFTLEATTGIYFGVDVEYSANDFQYFIPCLSKDIYYYGVLFSDSAASTDRYGFQNHHIVFNTTDSLIGAGPGAVHQNNINIVIYNHNSYTIEIYLMFTNRSYEKLFHVSDYVSIKTDDVNIIKDENIKGSLVKFQKEIPGNPNNIYLNAWSALDTAAYRSYTKFQYDKYFALMVATSQLQDYTITTTATGENLKQSISERTAQLLNLIPSSDEFINIISGSINTFADTVLQSIKNIGEFIYSAFKYIYTYISSLIENIIAQAESIIKYILPIAYIAIMYIAFNVCMKILIKALIAKDGLNYE